MLSRCLLPGKNGPGERTRLLFASRCRPRRCTARGPRVVGMEATHPFEPRDALSNCGATRRPYTRGTSGEAGLGSDTVTMTCTVRRSARAAAQQPVLLAALRENATRSSISVFQSPTGMSAWHIRSRHLRPPPPPWADHGCSNAATKTAPIITARRPDHDRV